MRGKRGERLIGLDILRIFSAFSVMFFHLAFWSWAPEADNTPKLITGGMHQFPELISLSWWGWVGVETFFVISGFVISFSASQATPESFFFGRVFRLLPSAVICATITAAVCVVAAPLTLTEIIVRYIRSVIFWPGGPWIDGVYWTLGIEVAFYSLVLVLLAMGRRHLIEPAMVVVGLASLTFWLVSDGLPDQLPIRVMQLTLMHHGMYFGLGVVMSAAFMRGLTPLRTGLCALFLAGGTIPITHQVSGLAAIEGLSSLWTPAFVWIACVVAFGLFIAFDTRIAAILSDRTKRAIAMLGVATYPLYLLHDIFGAWLMTIIAERYSALAFSMIVTTIMSLVIVAFLEAPPVRAAIKGAIAKAMLISTRADPWWSKYRP
ncbi:Peptidoglycan/LPS O-acetylase OafA/YrhL, contains acyltransferase and SGNH-hydrolase domains [Mesorhizobium muleiense]|uniref:Peptidoglycan/LPS O-acetylase OafA/YrhL, contains acyltransferase and SGNH-hydrolase domains n=1 Tax=Mesorhizobium muleiense TaxID=1004279 RepID=A0A1G9H2E5_9HYPH|nr:acyltransferase [Mesorhizobium muleiense]SDL07032.1 Peptidoglycan/LPS O-acetylase OafA/YrhL, contains acyltransferase and SGNH-hydrolase domains [Mesorhizobium muleiense]